MEKIRISAAGLAGRKVYVAHAKGGWGPEPKPGDYHKHPLTFNGAWLVCDGSFLAKGEEFKIVALSVKPSEAAEIHEKRARVGAHVGGHRDDSPNGEDYDYDEDNQTMWFLAENFPIVNAHKWNRNNVYEEKV